MRRLELLDGFRGYFLVFMLLNHLPFAGGLLLAKANHAELGFVQDAQGFVFLSGTIIGLYYMRLMQKGRIGDMDAKLAARVRELYWYHAGLLLLILTMAVLLPRSPEIWGRFMHELFEQPAANAAASLMLLYQPAYMDILPQYMVYLLVAPLLLRLIAAGRGQEVLVGSALLWLAVQLGWHLPLTEGLEDLVRMVLPGFTLRGHFNPLAWQIIFVTGMLLGAAEVQGRLDWQRWFGPHRTDLAKLALALLGVFLVYKLALTYGWISGAPAERFGRFSDRTEFGAVFLVNFTALAWLVTWLVVSGQESTVRAAQVAGRFLNGLFRLRPLVFLGQHSLQVYAYHLVLVYALMALDGYAGPFDEDTKTLITLAGIASLGLPAWAHASWQERSKAKTAVAKPAQ